MAAARKQTKSSFSKYVGVTQAGSYFAATIQVGGARYFLGNWPTERAAAIARDRGLLCFEPHAKRLNFAKASRRFGALRPEELKAEAKAAVKEARGCDSGYRGIFWSKQRDSWVIQLSRRRLLSGFGTDKEAAIIRDHILRYEGQVRLLNFPDLELAPKSFEQVKAERIRARARGRQSGIRFRGVYAHNNRPGRWGIHVKIDERYVCAGGWPTQRAAALAYDRAVLYYGLPRIYLNFPELGRKLKPSPIEELSHEARASFKATTSSRYRGVSLHTDRWTATVKHERKVYWLGRFEEEEDAARAYDKAAKELYGKEARLNFHPRTGRKLYGRRVG